MNDVVIVLHGAAGFDRAAQGVAGEGRRLAGALGGRLHALVLGAGDERLTSFLALVADAVTVADQDELKEYQPEPALDALTALIGPLAPRAVLLGNDTWSQELAPRLAHRLGGSAVADAVEITPRDGELIVRRSVYGGKAEAKIRLLRAPGVVALRARAFAPAATGEGAPVAIERARVELRREAPTRIIERRAEASGEARLEDARVIVSGGRGLGGPEPFKDLEELARLLGAQVAASRAACDAGWVPPSWQVGQTGKKVAPGLYLAIAIHGASQHLAGISDSRVIAAINIDPDAPIFKHCRFGIVEDYRRVVPLLRAKLAADET